MASLAGSGVGAVVMDFFRNIDKNKIVFDFWYDNDSIKDFFKDEAVQLGAKIYKYSPQHGLLRKHFVRMKALYDTVKANGYGIAHIHASDSICMEYAVACKMAGVKSIIVHSHNSYIPSDEKNYKLKIKIHKVLKHLWASFGNYFIAVSQDAAYWMYDEEIIKGDNFHILKNGINIEKYRYSTKIRKLWRKKLNISDDTLLLGNVGRLVAQKNPLFMIEILSEVKKIKKESKLLLVGRDGTQRNKMEEKIRQYGLENDVIFFGESNEINQLLQAMDVFIFPSNFEGLGIVAIEAQAAGLPVFASTGVPKDAKASENFWRIELDEGAERWARKIIDCLSDFNRTDTVEDVKRFGFDTRDCTHWLERLYLKCSNKNEY